MREIPFIRIRGIYNNRILQFLKKLWGMLMLPLTLLLTVTIWLGSLAHFYQEALSDSKLFKLLLKFFLLPQYQ